MFVSFQQATYTVAEGSSVQVKVTLDADPERTVTIPLTSTDQGGATSDDYSSVPTDVTFDDGETEQTFTLTAAADDVDDDGESVKLGFGATLPTGVNTGSTNETTISITDDDVPSVSVSFEQATYTVAEGSSVQVKVTLDADPERTVIIPIVKTDQGGASSDDYSDVPETVTITSGETEQTFTFTAASDDVDDDDESVRLGFGATLPTGVSAGDPNEATVSITDDDVPSVSVSFEQSTYTVAEGSSVQVKVTLDADPERTVIISLTATGQNGATASDYSDVPTSVTFDDGETEQTFTLTAAADDVDDDGESVKLGFGATLPTGVNTGSTNETTISITDDDVPSVSVSFEQATYTVAEGSSVQVKVTLDADPERTVIIPIVKTDQGGASSDDYSDVPETVTFDDGETEQTLTFEAAADSDNDDGESIKLGFGATLPTGVNTGSTNETTISITDDDVPQVVVSFEQATYTVAEGSSVQVKVTLDADPERTVIIPIVKTDQGGATSDDYSSVPTTVTLTSGETEQTFTFTAAADSDNDDGESIKLGFGSSLPTGVNTGTPSETTVSITDDDPSVFVSFEQSAYTVAEGSSVQVKVTLDADPERTVIIPIVKTDQGGASSDDYSDVPTTVTFTSGETEQTFTFTAASDDVDDDGESIKLGFGATLPTGVSTGTPSETTVSITDDDDPSVFVSFEQATYTVAEGSSVQVKVTLDADPERTVTIPIVKTDQGGATSDDYSDVPETVTFDDGETEQTFTFTAASDDVDDDDESVRLGFGATLPTGVSAGDPNEATVSITDDDVPSVSVSFEQAIYTVAEGSSVQVKMTLDADPERTVTIPIVKTDQGGATSDDYSSVPETVTFDDGETEQSFTFTAAADDVDDDGESVMLTFGATLPTGVSAGDPNEATVSITDDDVPSVSVSFEQATYTVAEGSSVQVKVTLDADPERTVTIPIVKTDQGGATSDDYSDVPETVTFDDGETEQTFTFTAASDDVDDDDESIRLGFGATLPTGVSAGDPNETTVSITDDDVPSVSVSFEQATYTVAEGSSVQVKVTLDADPERTVIIPIVKTDQGGATSDDYSSVPTTVTFTSGETEQTFTFTAASDDVDDDGESIKLGFGATLPTGVSAGDPNEATVSITDDDVPSVSVSFEQSTYTVAEGSSVQVKVTLDAP